MEYRLQLFYDVSAEDPPDAAFGRILRRLDDLLTESAQLRERITSALDREQHPFFPERRQAHQPHEPERRVR